MEPFIVIFLCRLCVEGPVQSFIGHEERIIMKMMRFGRGLSSSSALFMLLYRCVSMRLMKDEMIIIEMPFVSEQGNKFSGLKNTYRFQIQFDSMGSFT